MLFTILMFIILLSVVVLFHEFGHFIVGRFFKFGIDAFAVGFGRAIFSYKKGDIEYRFNWIPFGGYVKFVGELSDEDVPEEDKERSFSNRPAYQKAAVVFAGPFMNIVLAFLIFSVMFLVGFPTPTSHIGYVDPDSPAAVAGIVPNDRIVEIEGKPVWRWEEMSEIFDERADQPTSVVVERDGQRLNITVTPKMGEVLNLFRLPEQRGIIGVDNVGYKPIVGVPDPQSQAAQAGLESGMLVTAIDDKPIFYRETLQHMLSDGKEHKLTAVGNFTEPEEKWAYKTISLPPVEGRNMMAYGIEIPDLYIHSLPDNEDPKNKDQEPEKTPAQKAGLKPKDKILALEGNTITEWSQFNKIIKENPDKNLSLTVLRDGGPVHLTIKPELVEVKDIMGDTLRYGRIGVISMVSYVPLEKAPERYTNPFMILKRGVDLSFYWTKVTLQAFGLIFTGKVSPKSMGGPFTIADMAGKSARAGVFPFFLLMAIISLNLAVVNLVPIPIFDGGHLVFYLTEMVIRRPVNARIREAALRVGVALTGVLIIMIISFDINRYSLSIKNFFLNLVNF
jgi:regulator of sigma E protease